MPSRAIPLIAALLTLGSVAFAAPTPPRLFPEHSPSGDGLLTALMVLATLRQTGRSLSELASVCQPAPQILVNVTVREKLPLENLPRLSESIRRFEQELHGQGRVLIRYSGTENLLRIMVEGTAREAVETAAQVLAAVAREEIGAG